MTPAVPKNPPANWIFTGVTVADSPALRAKRSRRHKASDHRLCRSEACDAAGTSPHGADVPVTSRTTTHGLRGARLWDAMNAGVGLAPAHAVLLEEACRIADRLDRLDAMIEDPARAWLRYSVSDDGAEITVIVDRLLSEARQQELALKQIVTAITSSSEAEAASAAPVPPAGGGNIVGLRAAVLAKRAQTAG